MKNKQISSATGLAVLVSICFGFFLLAKCVEDEPDSPTLTEPAPVASTPAEPPPVSAPPPVFDKKNVPFVGVGENGVYAALGIAFDSEETVEEAVSATGKHDYYGIRDALGSGKGVMIFPGTQVLVLERKNTLAQVRILDGHAESEKRWVVAADVFPSEWVRDFPYAKGDPVVLNGIGQNGAGFLIKSDKPLIAFQQAAEKKNVQSAAKILSSMIDKGQVLESIPGQPGKILEIKNGIYRVRTNDGSTTGWVVRQWISPAP